MAAFILSVAAFLLAVGPHYFLRLRFLEGAYGAQVTLDCEWRYHPEIFLGLLLILVAAGSLKSRRALWGGLLVGVLTLAQAWTLEPISNYVGNENRILILAERIALRAHHGIGPLLAVLGGVVMAVSLLFMRDRRFFHRGRVDLLRLSARNLGRKRFRSAALALSISIAIGSIFAYTLLMSTVENTLELGAGRLGADLMVVPRGYEQSANRVLLSGEPSLFYMSGAVADTVRDTPGVIGASPQVYIQPLSYTVCCSAEKILLIGYDPDSDFTVAPWIEYVLRGKPGRNELVVGQSVKYYPGQSVLMYNEDFRVTGTLDRTGLGYFDNSGFLRLDEAYRVVTGVGKIERQIRKKDIEGFADESFTHLIPADFNKDVKLPKQGEVSAVFVKVASGVAVPEVARRLRTTLPDAAVVTVKASTRSVKEHITAIIKTFLWPIAILWLMCVSMVAGVYSMSVNERKKEIGILRAMGARRRDVSRLLIFEVSLLSVVGGIIGIELGVGIVLGFMENIFRDLNLMYIWPSGGFVGALVAAALLLALGTGLAAAIYPALRSSRLEPYATIRGGE